MEKTKNRSLRKYKSGPFEKDLNCTALQESKQGNSGNGAPSVRLGDDVSGGWCVSEITRNVVLKMFTEILKVVKSTNF